MLTIFPLVNKDSSYLQWQFVLDASLNPQEDRTIPTGHAVESKYGGCLVTACSYLENRENVYGLAITEASTKDSLLVETKRVVKGIPEPASFMVK